MPSLNLISFVIPAMNEEDSIEELYSRIAMNMSNVENFDFEVLFIDDGSDDATWEKMKALYHANPSRVRAFRLRKNFGKSQALNLGFSKCAGDLVFTMDADLQDDPDEIPRFIAKLEQGYDLVSGWKENRKDPKSKTLPSKLFNKVTSLVTGIELNDFNCGFKLYRKTVIESIEVYGELHRYIPVLAHDYGFKIAEIGITHHERKHGVSKFGWERYTRGLLDLLTVLVTTRYLKKPSHLFGGLGLLFGLLGFLSLSYLILLWLFGSSGIGGRPLLLFGALSTMVSVQLISLGLLSELINKNQDFKSLSAAAISEELS
ncbi:MAG: glycosyltransferase family 2 protein [Halioglobus sp.]